jgi:hypothetical protein
MSRNARIGVLVGAVVVIVAALIIVVAGSGGSDKAPDKVIASISVDKTGQPNGGIKHLTVKKNGTVDFTVTTAIPDEVHLHGYDIEKESPAGKPVRLNFKASMDGVFEVEVHKPTANQIAELEVQP